MVLEVIPEVAFSVCCAFYYIVHFTSLCHVGNGNGKIFCAIGWIVKWIPFRRQG